MRKGAADERLRRRPPQIRLHPSRKATEKNREGGISTWASRGFGQADILRIPSRSIRAALVSAPRRGLETHRREERGGKRRDHPSPPRKGCNRRRPTPGTRLRRRASSPETGSIR